MNATERARRSDSLYHDNVNRRTLCDMIANLESDLEDSKAENTKLQEQASSCIGRSFRTADKMSCIKDENAKLRELVRELYEVAQPEAPSMFEAEFADRMRELGIGVGWCLLN